MFLKCSLRIAKSKWSCPLEWVCATEFGWSFLLFCRFCLSLSPARSFEVFGMNIEHWTYFWYVQLYAYAQIHPLGFALMEWLYYVNIMILIIFSLFQHHGAHRIKTHVQFACSTTQLRAKQCIAPIESSSVFRYSAVCMRACLYLCSNKNNIAKGNEIIFRCILSTPNKKTEKKWMDSNIPC